MSNEDLKKKWKGYEKINLKRYVKEKEDELKRLGVDPPEEYFYETPFLGNVKVVSVFESEDTDDWKFCIEYTEEQLND